MFFVSEFTISQQLQKKFLILLEVKVKLNEVIFYSKKNIKKLKKLFISLLGNKEIRKPLPLPPHPSTRAHNLKPYDYIVKYLLNSLKHLFSLLG
jgi:hypothetical protein